MKPYVRKPLFDTLIRQLRGKANFIQAVVGPRQVGKTTLVLQVLEQWRGPALYKSADEPDTPSGAWIAAQWAEIRKKAEGMKGPALLILDEVQKIPRWSGFVKKHFDEDRRFGRNIRVVLLGSSALLMQRGLTESLAGRFELHRHFQWSFKECAEYFSLSLNEYLYYGGYPAELAIRRNKNRWMLQMRDSIIETVLSKDIILLMPITKPALLRQTFGVAVSQPAEIISYQKMLGTLQDAGNASTVASYLQLLSNAFLITPLERWSGSRIRQKGSTPKILVHDNALISAMEQVAYGDALRDTTAWGKRVENAVGAALLHWASWRGGELFYWRERDFEVDYVLKFGKSIIAIEVTTRTKGHPLAGIQAFKRRYPGAKLLFVSDINGDDIGGIRNVSLAGFFKDPSAHLC